MTTTPLLCAVLAALAAAPQPQTEVPPLKNGDIVLQGSRSAQGLAIQEATASPYNHVGLVEVAPDGVFVIEAINPVSRTPFERWRARGPGGRFTLLRHPGLTDDGAASVVREAKRFLGRPYDARFGWDDRKLYCSELVAKAFQRGAGLAVGRMQKLRELHIAALLPAIRARYGKRVNLDLELLTPASIAEDARLRLVYSSVTGASASSTPR